MRYCISKPGGIIEPTTSVLEWARWFEGSALVPFEDGGRQVASAEPRDGVVVSTVFLGLNHGWGDARPLLFETMIFGGPCDAEQWRYCTAEAARAGHADAVRLACGEPSPAHE